MSDPKRLSDSDKAFYAGFAVAIATLIKAHDQPSLAVDIMRNNGVSLDDLRKAKVDGIDLRPISMAWKGNSHG